MPVLNGVELTASHTIVKQHIVMPPLVIFVFFMKSIFAFTVNNSMRFIVHSIGNITEESNIFCGI